MTSSAERARFELLRFLVAVAALGIGVANSASAAAAERPNIVLVMTDDLGWMDSSAHRRQINVNPDNRCATPNIERLAASGLLFTNARMAAVCSPTRVSIMTGQNPARHRVTNWTLDLNRPPNGDGPLLLAPKDWNFNSLQPIGTSINNSIEAPTLAQLLTTAGYRTIHVGKAHWGAIGTPGAMPTNLGFDTSVAGTGYGGVGSYFGRDHFQGADRREIPDLKDYYSTDTYLTTALTGEALKLIRKSAVAGQRFFLHLSHHAVHLPLMADAQFVEQEKQRGLSGPSATYASMVLGIDQSLGQILDELERLELTDDTVVMFMSDNGGVIHDGVTNAPFRGEKGTGYDGGLRVPMIVRWPGTTTPGSTCETNVVAEDIFATLLSIAGAELPQEHRPHVDGVDLTRLLAGDNEYLSERPVFFHQPHYHQGRPFSAVVKDEWKLILWHEDGDIELFDVSRDIGESRNVAEQQPRRADAMLRTLVSFLRDVHAQFPFDRKTQLARRLEDLAPVGQ